MTPIILNLLAEERQAEHASARDPVKIAIAGAIVVVSLAIGAGILISYFAGVKQAKAGELEKRLEKMAATQSAGKFRQLRAFTDSLATISDKRVLLAPQLARIKDLVPPRIHLNSIMFHTTLETVSAGPTPEGGKASRPRTVERLSLRLEGEAVGGRSSIEVDSFLQTLRSDPMLSNQMDEVTLRSIGTSPGVEGQDSRNLKTQFVIECYYKEIK